MVAEGLVSRLCGWEDEMYQEKVGCRVCGGGLETQLNLGNLYLNNFVEAVDLRLPKAPLDLTVCKACGLAQLRHTTSPDLLYRRFWYRSAINESMRASLLDVVEEGMRYHTSGVWVDIGANDGWMLGQLRDFHRIGIEPALNLLPELSTNCDEAIPEYYGRRPHLPADIITSIAMFYDLDDPLDFTRKVRDGLTANGVWINQLSYTPEMLRRNAFDNICHEHLCYYDLRSLQALYFKAGLKLVDFSFNETNGGSIRTVAARDDSAWEDCTKGLTEEADWTAFGERVRKWRLDMLTILPHLPKVWIYGASTKGNTLLQYLNFHKWQGAADRNPDKHGKLTVGSWVRIHDEEEAREKAEYFVALPWAFRDAFVEREQPWLRAGGRLVMPLPNIEVIG